MSWKWRQAYLGIRQWGPVLGWWAGDWVNRRSVGGLSELGLEEVWLVG